MRSQPRFKVFMASLGQGSNLRRIERSNLRCTIPSSVQVLSVIMCVLRTQQTKSQITQILENEEF